ncbi:hypothetical protein OUZ56_009603 [Daphnia magna]|uniref:Uncharacterized protein n=1 Tax=Daphnia magna TaxID=35525 RepID=A0ABR0AGH9_9CRUS|nr:hypothetical protein OUZ56_009603 [Daphnia magna]
MCFQFGLILILIRSKENQATLQSDINSESDQHAVMGRGKRNKRAPGRYLLTETVQDARCSSDDSNESVGMYGPTQPSVQQAITPAIPHGLVSNAISQQTTDFAAWHQPFPFEQTPSLQQGNRRFLFIQIVMGRIKQGELCPSSSQFDGAFERVQPVPVITAGLADQANELPEGLKAVLAKLVKEVL